MKVSNRILAVCSVALCLAGTQSFAAPAHGGGPTREIARQEQALTQRVNRVLTEMNLSAAQAQQLLPLAQQGNQLRTQYEAALVQLRQQRAEVARTQIGPDGKVNPATREEGRQLFTQQRQSYMAQLQPLLSQARGIFTPAQQDQLSHRSNAQDSPQDGAHSQQAVDRKLMILLCTQAGLNALQGLAS